MPLKLNMPVPRSGGGFTTSFKLSAAKHMLRIYPYQHEGEVTLAAVKPMHFIDNVPHACIGPTCVHCATAKAMKTPKGENNRLRRVTRYSMAVVDIDGDKSAVLRFDAPASVYKAIHGILQEEDPSSFLGNNGIDFIIRTNANSSPSDRYSVSPRVKGSGVLDIDEDSVPDMTDEAERDLAGTAGGPVAHHAPASAEDDPDTGAVVEKEDDDEKTVVFKDSKGKKVTGVYTGKKRQDKFVIEANGSLCMVDIKKVVSGAEHLEG